MHQRPRTVSAPKIPKAELEVFTKQEFNYKRNNSVLMSTCLTWDFQDESDQVYEDDQNERREVYDAAKYSRRSNDSRVQQDSRRNIQNKQSPQTGQQNPSNKPKTTFKQDSKNRQISKSQPKPKKDYSKFQKTQEQLLQQKQKQHERRQKIKSYIQSLVPYSRTIQDSKFQKFYQKAAPIMYGGTNTKQAIGGMVYGNNLRSFNVNPHDYQNNPKTYQTHTTALNFAARCKKDEEKHWKRLEKELGKKLNLHQKNHSLKQGKNVVYVDVNDDNMNELMKENLEFKRDHRQQIRQSQKDYQHQKQMKFLAKKQKFYQNKAESIQKNLQATRASNSRPKHDRLQADRIQQQVLYKHHDQHGNIRIGADRHALTCFVDINFPQNDKLYTQQLKNRLPIYPTNVDNKHKHIGQKKRQNYYKNKQSIYPSHYLVPCSDQPQIQKMLIQKGNSTQSNKQAHK